MNEFERAIAKTEKREQRKTLTLAKVEEPAPVVAATKEKKPSLDGIITVGVVLPYDSFELTFTKPNVMGMKRLSRADFHRAIVEGLKSILGGVR
jgi:hypothetical protein